MKHVFFFAGSLLLLSGCGFLQDEPLTPDPNTTAEMNGETWSARAEAFVNESAERLQISFEVYVKDDSRSDRIPDPAGTQVEDLLFTLPLEGEGTYNLQDSTDVRHFYMFDDVIGPLGAPLESATNTMTITSYDREEEEVAGTFEVAFLVQTIDGPDTLRFTDGRFTAPIQFQSR